MSRNNDTARNVHIGANVISTGLFLWQVGLHRFLVLTCHPRGRVQLRPLLVPGRSTALTTM